MVNENDEIKDIEQDSQNVQNNQRNQDNQENKNCQNKHNNHCHKNGEKGENYEKAANGEHCCCEDKKLTEEELFIQAVEKIRNESKENLDKFLRLSAEFVNYKNRVEREKLELVKYSAKEIIKELLPFIDTFDSALNARHQNLEECVKGFDLVHKSLFSILKKEGLERINVEGQKFNPELHEAVGFDNFDELEENLITFEMQAGYKLKDKVLRHSMVKINKK